LGAASIMFLAFMAFKRGPNGFDPPLEGFLEAVFGTLGGFGGVIGFFLGVGIDFIINLS
jgi:hypothetical protein